ncbi:MobF family relaxase [Actinokineospora sp. HUAS TT18]|uniref:MobF family relaxase n=1 Tax=Actinokineospora sp. HUAS TT18 TaxID=3447451 RepID=UPI003F527711
MAWVTTIGSDPQQIDYRLGLHHGCRGDGVNDKAFGYRTDLRERPLRWIGAGLADVDIVEGSELPPEQFPLARALINGYHPRDSHQLVKHKLGIPAAAKLPLAVLVREIEGIAREAATTIADVLHLSPRAKTMFERAERAVAREGETAALRADHATQLAQAAGLHPERVWDPAAYRIAMAALTTISQTVTEDGTVTDTVVPNRIVVGNLGYDVTLTLPKSFSLALAFLPEEQAAEFENTYLAGCDSVFRWLETTTAYGMRGHHGDGATARTVRGTGFLGWSMIHRAARPIGEATIGDPHWHIHYTIANMTHGVDGAWSTIAAGGRDLMRHVPAADKLAQAAIRHALAQRGVAFRRSQRTGRWEVAAIDDPAIAQFSKFGNSIEAQLDALGLSRADAPRPLQHVVADKLRNAKPDLTAAADDTLRGIWQREARDHGHQPHQIARDLLDPTTTSPATPDIDDLARILQNPETGLTAHTRRFSRVDALAAVADALPNGATPDEVERLTDQVLRHAGFVELPDLHHTGGGRRAQRGSRHMRNAQLYTTDDVIAAEHTIVTAAHTAHPGQTDTRVDDDSVTLATITVEATQGFTLSAEQHRELHRIATSGTALDTLIGGPGSGKTTLMRALRVAYETRGLIVAGAATQGVAALTLHAESGITSRTVAQWLWRITHGPGLHGIDILVLDEATLTDDRDRATLYRAATDSGTKILEIGDPKQLRGVGCGSMFATIHRLTHGGELLDNRRQKHEAERTAIHAWRTGIYTDALLNWAERDRLIATETHHEATQAMLDTWTDQRHGAPDPITEMRGLLMVAATNDQVDQLNTLAQAHRHHAGELGPHHTYRIHDRTLRLHQGDHILIRTTDRDQQHHHGHDIYNGYRAHITTIAADGALTIEWETATPDGPTIETATLPTGFIETGAVELGYALTIHKSQGLTIGTRAATWTGPDGHRRGGTVLLAAAAADNPGVFVAASRHTHDMWLFIAREDVETPHDLYLNGPPNNHWERLRRVITRVADHAHATGDNANDRPTLVDLGVITEPPDPATQAAEQLRRDQAQTRRDHTAARRAERQHQRDQATRDRDDRTETARRDRAAAYELLTRTWWQHSDLVDHLVTEPAFGTVARRLREATESGHDPYAILEDIPLDTLTSPRIHDKAAFMAAMIDIAIDRIRTGAAARDHAEQRRHDQLRDQVTDLIHDTWPHHPHIAEHLIHGVAFDELVNALDQYAHHELDPRDLLAAIPVGKLTDPTIRDISRFTVYTVHRIARKRLEDLDRSHAQAESHARELAHRDHAAHLLRQAWDHHPAADTVLNGPAFSALAHHIHRAIDNGIDTNNILATLTQIDPAAATSHRIHNPSAYVTALFRDTHTASPPDATADQQPSRVIRQPADPNTTEPDQRTAALAEAHELQRRVDADRGPAVTQLNKTLAHHRQLTHDITEFHTLERAWNTQVDLAATHAQARANAQLQRSHTRNPRDRALLAAQIHDHTQAENTAQQQAQHLANRAHELQQRIGPPHNHTASLDAAQAAEANYPNHLAQARQTDLHTLTRALNAAQASADSAQVDPIPAAAPALPHSSAPSRHTADPSRAPNITHQEPPAPTPQLPDTWPEVER